MDRQQVWWYLGVNTLVHCDPSERELLTLLLLSASGAALVRVYLMIVGRRFDHERVVVSGERFERCVFVGCELVADGRPVQLVDNSFEGCHWSFEGAAGVTLDLLAALCREDPSLRAAVTRHLGLTAPPVGASVREMARLH